MKTVILHIHGQHNNWKSQKSILSDNLTWLVSSVITSNVENAAEYKALDVSFL